MRILVRAAEAWIRQNQPDPDALYSTVDNGFLQEAETAYFVAMDEYRKSLDKAGERASRVKAGHLPDRAWGVYQLIDDAGRVLYVGMTGRPRARVRQHLREFGERIDWVDFQRFPTRVAAYDAETAMIRTLLPPMNIAKAPR